MKVAELLARRRENWQQLERLCGESSQSHGVAVAMVVASLAFPPLAIVALILFFTTNRSKEKRDAKTLCRFAALYRAACADLALADAYQLPPNTVQYLHRLVGRAHNQLYRSRTFEVRRWAKLLLHETPQRIFNDRCVHFAALLFLGVFVISAYLAHTDVWPGFSDEILTPEGKEDMEHMFADPIDGRAWEDNIRMAANYINHNTTIGIQCFASCLLLVPGLIVVIYNAAVLGASFGFMFRPETGDAGQHFGEFVMAHGPFELTAIMLSAGAGLRIGLGWIRTNGLTRSAALTKTAKESMPLVFTAIILFFLAAMIEGFISPSGLPVLFKGIVGVFCMGLLLFYFIFLGFLRPLLLSRESSQE